MTKLIFAISLLFILQACQTNQLKQASEQPDDMLKVYQEAMQAYNDGDMVAAEAGLKLITEHVPKDASAWFRLGNVYARTDRPEFAVVAYKEALIRDPDRSKAWHNMGVIYLRQAANAFAELQSYAKNYDPLKPRAALYATTIEEMLGGRSTSVTTAKPAQETAPKPGQSKNLILKPADGLMAE